MYLFILGILFTLIGLPTIECFMNFLSNRFELSSYKIIKQIYEIQKTMPEKEEEQQKKPKYPMGFSTSCEGFEIDVQENQEKQGEQ